MKILYLVNINEHNRKGLFTATHERIKELVKYEGLDKYEIYSIKFYDGGLFKLLKKITKKKLRVKGEEYFTYEGLNYKNVYIKVGMVNKAFEKLNLDFINFLPMIMKYKKDIKKCDMVSAHWGYPHGRIAYFINKLFNKLYIVTYHGSDIHTMPVKDKQVRKKVIKVLDNAYKNIFVSNKLYIASKKIGYDKSNYLITKNGVNTNIFHPINDSEKSQIKENLNLNKVIIGFVGNLNKVKRCDKLIEIFYNIRKKLGNDDISFIVVGDGPLKKTMIEEAKVKNLDVHFMGNVQANKVRDYMNIMDVMVLPSKNEGFGCVIIEANACETVVVGSNVGGIEEAIGDKNLLVDDGEDFEIRFASKVYEVLNSNYDKEELTKRVKQDFTWEIVAKDEIHIYEGVRDE